MVKLISVKFTTLSMSPLRLVSLSVVFILLFVCTSSLAQPTHILHQSFAERYPYFDSLREYLEHNCNDTQQAKYELDLLIAYAEKKHDAELAYMAKVSKIYIVTTNTKTRYVDEIVDVINEAKKKGFNAEAADGYYTLAAYMHSQGRTAKSIEYALSGYALSKSYNQKQFPPKGKYQHTLATAYYHYGEYNKTKQVLLQFKETEQGSLYSILGSRLNTLALAYRQLKQYDSAIYYFNEIYSDREQLLALNTRALAAGNIGSIYYLQEDYPTALDWLNKEITLWRLAKGAAITKSCFGAYTGIADIHFKTGNMGMARIYLDSARRIRPAINALNHLEGYYNTTSNILRQDGRLEEAIEYMDSAAIVKDRIAERTNLSKLMDAENRVAEARHNFELAQLDTIRQKSIWVRNFAILLIAFAALVIIFIVNRSRQKHKEKQLVLENEKNKAQADLLKFTKTLQDKNRQLATLQEEIEVLTSHQDIASQNELIYQLQQSTILTDEQWVTFRDMFEQVHAGYINRIKTRYPEVTPAEIRYMVLVMLDMNTKEIANVLGINTATVRNLKHRMRKKFDVSEETALETFIKNL